jgi:hypothetical protein
MSQTNQREFLTLAGITPFACWMDDCTLPLVQQQIEEQEMTDNEIDQVNIELKKWEQSDDYVTEQNQFWANYDNAAQITERSVA